MYEDSDARANAAWCSVAHGADLLVLDTQSDNFGSYARDGLRNRWQFQNFGPGDTLAAPTLAPFGDGLSNQLKHA